VVTQGGEGLGLVDRRDADFGVSFTSHVLYRSLRRRAGSQGHDQVLVAELMATLTLRSTPTACPTDAHRKHAIDKLRTAR
jgi:hypothetical protein